LQSKLAECAKFTAKNSDTNINIIFIQNNLSNFSEQLTLEWGIRQPIAGLPKANVGCSGVQLYQNIRATNGLKALPMQVLYLQ
jgi:hypothetical protein